MGKRGMGLFMVPVDWQQLLYVKPDALVCLDAYHLPATKAGGVYALWRPWTGPRQIKNWTPADWLATVAHEWYSKGQPHFDAIQFCNEPNLEVESGYPSGSPAAAAAGGAAHAGCPLVLAAGHAAVSGGC